MALVDLKSDLAWYGKHQQSNLLKTSTGGYKPNENRADTKYKINKDLSVSTDVKGFDNAGFFTIGHTKTSGNSFLIDDVSYSQRGFSSRKNQLGDGTRLPISPQGNIHDMVPSRLGFYSQARYGDLYGVRYGTSGLADTYTNDSPIDDMYNKFKVREEAFNPFGADKNNGEPYILRGIQRNGKTDPQYWGLGEESSLQARIAVAGTDIPRGGMVVYADRYDTDLRRLNKWRQSPHGKAFVVKQAALNMFNPLLTKGLPNIAKSALALGIVTAYESAQIKSFGGPSTNTNRLVLLKRELLNTVTGSPIGFNGGFVGQLSNIVSGGFDNPLGNIFSRSTNSQGILQDGNMQMFSYNTPYADSKNNDPGSHSGKGRNAALLIGGGLKSQPNEYATTKGRSEGKEGFCTSKNYKTLPWSQMPNRATACNPKIWDWLTQSDRDPNANKKKLANIEYDSGKYVRNPIYPHTRKEGKFEGGGAPKKSGQQWDYKAIAYSDIPKTTQKDKHKSPGGRVEQGGYKGQGDYMKPKAANLTATGYSPSGFKLRWDVDKAWDTNYGSGDGMELKFETEDAGEVKLKIFLTGLSEEHAPNWTGEADQGRADPRYLYDGYERTVAVSFIISPDRSEDFGKAWSAVQSLAHMTMPVYPDKKGFHGQICKFTLGASGKGLFYQCPVLISGLSYDWDPTEASWEVDEYMLPFRTSVDMSLIILGNQKSGEEGGRIQSIKDFQVYGKDLSSDGGGGGAGGGGGGGAGGEGASGPITGIELDPIGPSLAPTPGSDIPTGAPPGNTPGDVANIMTNTNPETEPLDAGPNSNTQIIPENINASGVDGGEDDIFKMYFANGTPVPFDNGNAFTNGSGDIFTTPAGIGDQFQNLPAELTTLDSAQGTQPNAFQQIGGFGPV